MNYLTFYQPKAFITLDVTPYEVNIHYFNMRQTDDEVKETGKKLDRIRVAGSQIKYICNPTTEVMTFDVTWPYESDND